MNWYKTIKLAMEYSYSCVMAPITGQVADDMLSWAKKNISEDKLIYSDDADGIETDPHVTVLYGLHSDEPNEVKDQLINVKPFELVMGKISKFSNDGFDVIKIGIQDGQINKINELLKELPNSNKYPMYIPHATLAYVEKNSCDELLDNDFFEGKTVKIDNLIFGSSSLSGNKKTNIPLIEK